MTKRMKCIVIIILLVEMLTGCRTQQPDGSPGLTLQPTITGAPVISAGTSAAPSPTAIGSIEDVKVLLPDKTGFRWRYFGFAEYAMSMELKTISQTNGVLSYLCEGEVADMSDGEAQGDFGVRITYKVMPGVLSQELTGEKALDNVYPNLELIRAPLVKGTKWVQAVKDSKGADANLNCEIADVKQAGGRNVYFVTYRTEGSDYYEKREITENMGVTAFDRLYEFENLNDLIGYRIYIPDAQAQAGPWEQWLPQLDREYTYFGLAEYGHKGRLTKLTEKENETLYEYHGTYNDGTGKDDKFIIRYFADAARGTVTEQIVSNERGPKEVNSKLHNLVILKFPLAQGSHWSHTARLNDRQVTVQATITEYDDVKGVVKVRYIAMNADG